MRGESADHHCRCWAELWRGEEGEESGHESRAEPLVIATSHTLLVARTRTQRAVRSRR
jgi:hypothetical protein